MTLEQIENLKLDCSCAFLMVDRILSAQEIPDGEKHYEINESFYSDVENNQANYLDFVTVHESLEKPTYEQVVAEFSVYKIELIVEENARLDEIARVQDIKERWDNIDDITGAFYKAEIVVGNPALELNRIIEENDQSLLSQLESSYAVFKSENSSRKIDLLKIKKGQEARMKCQNVLDYIAGENLERELTIEQITQMQTAFSEIESALRAGRPDLATMAANASTPDGIIVTQELKDKVIGLLS